MNDHSCIPRFSFSCKVVFSVSSVISFFERWDSRKWPLSQRISSTSLPTVFLVGLCSQVSCRFQQQQCHLDIIFTSFIIWVFPVFCLFSWPMGLFVTHSCYTHSLITIARASHLIIFFSSSSRTLSICLSLSLSLSKREFDGRSDASETRPSGRDRQIDRWRDEEEMWGILISQRGRKQEMGKVCVSQVSLTKKGGNVFRTETSPWITFFTTFFCLLLSHSLSLVRTHSDQSLCLSLTLTLPLLLCHFFYSSKGVLLPNGRWRWQRKQRKRKQLPRVKR